MAYVGKFIDRNPKIRTAGIVSNIVATTGDSLQIHSIEEAAEGVVRSKCIEKGKLQRDKMKLPHYPYIPQDSLKDIMSPDLKKSRFVSFREKFSEDMYFKKPELGKSRSVNAKPDDITNENTCFGDRYKRSEPLYELVLPRKTPDEVNQDYIKWHDKYIVSHGHYLPGEQISRHYDQNFDPKATFGEIYNVDFSGKYVKRVLSPRCGVLLISKVQKEFMERTHGWLGKKSKKYGVAPFTCAPYGISTISDECNVKALLENMDPCETQCPLTDAIGHINKLRQKLFSRLDFHMFDLKSAFERMDQNQTGYLKLDEINRILRSMHIFFNSERLTTALEHFKIVENVGQANERVDYNRLWKLLHIQFPLPKTGNISRMPPNVYNKETTYRVLCSDRTKQLPPERPQKPPTETPTSAKDVVSPDIPMYYGLGPEDFAQLRPKEQLRGIFKRLLDNAKFDEVWERTRQKLQPPDELISVDQLRDEMNNSEETKTKN